MNTGRGTAEDVRIRVTFINEAGETCGEAVEELGDVAPDEEVPFLAAFISYGTQAKSVTWDLFTGDPVAAPNDSGPGR